MPVYEPLPVTALRDKQYEDLYSQLFTEFNPVQAQVFDAIYNSDDSCWRRCTSPGPARRSPASSC